MTAEAKRPTRSWRYCLGVGVSLATGGYLGFIVYRMMFRFVFGPDPLAGFVRTVTQLDRNGALAVGTLVILTKYALEIIGGLLLLRGYDALVMRAISRRHIHGLPGKRTV